MGDFESLTLVREESAVKYHPWVGGYLTFSRNPGKEQCQRVSLTGAVSSKIVTEEPQGTLDAVGNRVKSVRV